MVSHRMRGAQPSCLVRFIRALNSGFAMGVYTTLVAVILLALFFGISVGPRDGEFTERVEKQRQPRYTKPRARRPGNGDPQNQQQEVQDESLYNMPFQEVCNQRTATFRETGELPRTVSYLPSTFKPEAYIKGSFREHGFHDIGENHREATFIIGKATAEMINWEVCRDTMKHNHIPGQKSIVVKHELAATLQKADHWGNISRLTGIAQSSTFHKPSYAVWRTSDCKELMQVISNTRLDTFEARQPQYISKEVFGGHNGKGLTILDGHDMELMYKNFRKTGKCGEDKVLVQKFLRNPLLLQGRTFNLRLYFIVLRLQPALVAFYDGYARLTRSKFDLNSTDVRSFISNSEKVWGNKKQKRDEQAAKHFWHLEELVQYLAEQGMLPPDKTPEKYLDEVLRPKFKAICAHIYRSAQTRFVKSGNYFAVFGPDMTLDNKLNPWVFEVNFSPELSRFIPLEVVEDMYPDLIEAQMALFMNPSLPWKELSPLLRSPDRFHIIVDDQTSKTATYPT